MKRLFSGISRLFQRSKTFLGVLKYKKISKAEAIKIQRETYNSSRACRRNTFDETYLDIAEFLRSPSNEVFFSAVSDLKNIAMNSARKKSKIIKLMENALNSYDLSEEQKKYLVDNIDEISNITY